MTHDEAARIIRDACHNAGLERPRSIRIEFDSGLGIVIGYLPDVDVDACDAIVTHAFKYLPITYGIEIRKETA